MIYKMRGNTLKNFVDIQIMKIRDLENKRIRSTSRCTVKKQTEKNYSTSLKIGIDFQLLNLLCKETGIISR